MQRISRVRQALATAGVATLVLASSAVAGASSITGIYNAAAAKLVPAAYKGKVLQVASDATYAPDEYMSGTKMVGFEVNLINAIAKTLGLKANENNVTFDNIIAGIKSNHYVIGSSSFTDTKAREAQVNFVDYFQAGEGVYAKSTSKLGFAGLASFCGYNVAVETGSTEQADAQTAATKCPASKKLNVLRFSNQTEVNVAVASGHAQFGFADSQVAGYIVATSKGAFKLVGKAVNVAPYGLAMPKTAAGLELAKAIQAALKVLIANGTYHAILAGYGLQAGALPLGRVRINGATS